MSWASLRLRLVAGGLVAILIALAIAGGGLIVLFERHVARTLADDLDVHLKQLLAAIDVDADGKLVVTPAPADPRFADPLSGFTGRYRMIAGSCCARARCGTRRWTCRRTSRRLANSPSRDRRAGERAASGQ